MNKERGGEQQYSGEPVTQLQHALQTAALGETPSLRGVDDVHQYRALPFLRGLFADEVLDAIRLHVNARRCLCATPPGYHASLSADARRGLLLQGGIYTADEASRFMARPGAEGAVKLRLWDELAKDARRITPPLTHFLARAQRCALSPSRPAVAV